MANAARYLAAALCLFARTAYSWGFNASEPIVIGYVCDFAERCCAAQIAAANLAIKHVSERNSTVVSEVAMLPPATDMPRIVLVEIDSHGPTGIYDAVVAYFATVDLHLQPTILLGLHTTADCDAIAPFIQQYNIPAFTTEAFGPFGEVYSSPSEYSEIFRLVGPMAELVEMMDVLMDLYNFSRAALVYDENVKVEESLMHELTRHYSSTYAGDHQARFLPYHLEDNTTATIDALLDQVASKGIQTFVLLLEDYSKSNELTRRAYRRGIAGNTPSAVGFAWISLASYIPWEHERSHADHYIGMLSVEQHTYDDDKIHPFAELWKDVMPQGCDLVPRGPKFPTKDRNHMPYTACPGIPNAYDAIVAIALATAWAMSGDVYSPTLPAQCPWNYVTPGHQETSKVLSYALHSGVHFAGLSGNFSRSGTPWTEKRAVWEVTNLQDLDGTTVDLIHWTRARGLVEVFATTDRHLSTSERQLGASGGGSVTVMVNGRYIWPGNTHVKPEGVIHSPCEHVDCGFHGTCHNRMSVGRSEGWCQCDPGFIGRLCDILYEPYVLSDHPDVVLHQATHVDAIFFVESLRDVDEDEEVFTVGTYEYYHWLDQRVTHLEPGEYSFSECEELERLRLFWYPKVTYDRLISQTRTTGTLTIRADGNMELLLHREVVLSTSMRWDSFPFQDQTLHLDMHPIDTDNVILTSMKCSHPDAPYECNYMGSPDGWLGLPSTAWDNDAVSRGDWLRLWTPVNVVKTESADGKTLSIRMTLSRDSVPMLIRIIIPSFFLVCVSWAGFFITPTKLMPRFASSFISFLALQTFKSNVLRLTPGEAVDLTWMDMYMSVVGQMMVYAVFENVYVQYVFEHHSERSAKFLDVVARKLFPSNFIMQVSVMFITVIACRGGGTCVSTINVAMHIWVLVFLFILVIAAYYEYKTSIKRILKQELGRITHLIAAHDGHSDVLAELLIHNRELESMFELADKDHSGYAEVSEILQWLDHELKFGEEKRNQVEQELRDFCPEDFNKGITPHTLENVLRKIFACLAIPDGKDRARMLEPLLQSTKGFQPEYLPSSPSPRKHEDAGGKNPEAAHHDHNDSECHSSSSSEQEDEDLPKDLRAAGRQEQYTAYPHHQDADRADSFAV